MLVLSRRSTEKILFPGINTAIQVVSIKGGTVRLGIEAPPDVIVLRAELKDAAEKWQAAVQAGDSAEARLDELRHQLRNRLNSTTLALGVLRLQAQAGLSEKMERTIATIEEDMHSLGQHLGSIPTKSSTPRPHPTRRMGRALLVEDDQNERELLAGLLRMSGFTVSTAGDGCDALDHLRRGERPDVVLLDMGMPRCDGATTAREIRRDPNCAGLRIFAVTGRSREEFGLDLGPSGVDRWFTKPLDPMALLRELNQEIRAE
jgi:carbon storage regulator CsrA